MLEERIAVANLKKPADLVLENARLVNVFSGRIEETNIAILEDRVVGVGQQYNAAAEIIDIDGRFVLPGLIDGHIHLESSLLAPSEFAKAVLGRGTTSVVIDPHEIANVVGSDGIEYVLHATEKLPVSFYILASSCVPATNMETSGCALTAGQIGDLLDHERVIGLAELMNFPGVVNAVPEVIAKAKVARSRKKVIDGHAPGLRGAQLQAYLNAGVGSDHECSDPAEAQEKLASGMRIMIREGSAARNLEDLLPVVTEVNARRIILVSDDLHPDELLSEGHLDRILRKAVGLGLDPVTAVQMVTINPAEYFGLAGTGAVAPNYYADLITVDDLTHFGVGLVVKRGDVVARDGLVQARFAETSDTAVRDTVRVSEATIEDFAIKDEGKSVKVIKLVPDQIITEKKLLKPTVRDGMIVADADRDIVKLAVFERHKRTGNITLGLLQGLGLKEGAIASSVAHDSHNILLAGADDKDMLVAFNHLRESGGGFAVASGSVIKASLPLPLAGLMSDKPINDVVEALEELLAAFSEIGSNVSNPFITLSFCSLAVIPELKITDKGLIDVPSFSIVSMFGDT